MTIAPSGVGKATCSQIPALLYPHIEAGNWATVDPKCQLAVVTYKAMNSNGRRAVYINAFRMFMDILGAPIGYNPMSSMDPTTIHFAVDCDSLAQAIVVYVSGEPHWTDSAQILISGFIYYFRKYGKPDEQNLVSVRAAIGLPPKAFRALINTMADTGDHLLIERISRFIDLNDDDREALGILSTAKTQTAFIGNEAIRESLKGAGNFSFKDLRETPGLAVFIILPGEYLDTCSKWFRVLVASALRELLANREGETVNFMLDEFAQLGHLKAIENTIALARGYGVRMWPILQDLPQLKRIYPESYETFLSSSSVVQFFGVRDLFTAEWIERRAGENTAKGQGTSISRNDNGISRGTSTGEVARPAISAHDAMSLGENEQIIFAAAPGEMNANAIIAQRLPYWKIDGLQGTWLPDPYHTKRKPAKAAPITPPAPADNDGSAAPVTP
jgi:type IV secretion system protein VirD4